MTETTGNRHPERAAAPGSTAAQLAELGLRARTTSAYRAPAVERVPAEPAAPDGPTRPAGDIDQGTAGRTQLYDGTYRTATPAQVNAEISRLRDGANRGR